MLLLTSPQMAIWAILIIPPLYALNRAWYRYLGAALGSRELVDALFLLRPAAGHRPTLPQVLFSPLGQVSGSPRRRFGITIAGAALAAAISWFAAGIVAAFVNVPGDALRAIQVLWFACWLGIHAFELHREPTAARWMPGRLGALGIAVCVGAIVLTVLPNPSLT